MGNKELGNAAVCIHGMIYVWIDLDTPTNGAAMPETCQDEVTGAIFGKGTIVALKRVPTGTKSIQDGLSRRINLLYTEVLTTRHPPLLAHPNILKLLGIGFEVEGHESDRNVMPVRVPECAELRNLGEVFETAK